MKWIDINDQKPLNCETVIFIVKSKDSAYNGKKHIGDYLGDNRCLSHKTLFEISHWISIGFLPYIPQS